MTLKELINILKIYEKDNMKHNSRIELLNESTLDHQEITSFEFDSENNKLIISTETIE